LELSDRNLAEASIVEIAVVLTDYTLRKKVVGPHFVIQTDLDTITDERTKERFEESGLMFDMQEGSSSVTVADAEKQILKFLRGEGIV